MPNGRCRMHGGPSTGPRTSEGIARCTSAPTKHGGRDAAARTRARQRGVARKLTTELHRIVNEICKLEQKQPA